MKLQISKTSFPLREELWKSEQQQRNVTICDDLSIVRYDLPQRKGWTLDDFASSKNPLFCYIWARTSDSSFIIHLQLRRKKVTFVGLKNDRVKSNEMWIHSQNLLEHPVVFTN